MSGTGELEIFKYRDVLAVDTQTSPSHFCTHKKYLRSVRKVLHPTSSKKNAIKRARERERERERGMERESGEREREGERGGRGGEKEGETEGGRREGQRERGGRGEVERDYCHGRKGYHVFSTVFLLTPKKLTFPNACSRASNKQTYVRGMTADTGLKDRGVNKISLK